MRNIMEDMQLRLGRHVMGCFGKSENNKTKHQENEPNNLTFKLISKGSMKI